jgi:hypothetical protein
MPPKISSPFLENLRELGRCQPFTLLYDHSPSPWQDAAEAVDADNEKGGEQVDNRGRCDLTSCCFFHYRLEHRPKGHRLAVPGNGMAVTS